MTRQDMKALAKQQIKGKLGSLFVINLVIFAISMALSFIPVVGSIATFFVSPALSLGTTLIFLNLCKNNAYNPTVSDLFAGFQNVWGAFKVYIAQTVFVFLWMLLFIIPGYVKGIAYSQAFYILAENPEIGGREALKKSSQMMEGHKMEYFVLTLSFIGWIFLSMFTCGILFIWLIPYMNAAYTNFYNSIKPATAESTASEAQFD